MLNRLLISIDVALPLKTPEQTRRIIDAGLDRIGEGLRFLEDVARFLLDDAALTQQLKTMRHQLASGDPSFNRRLLQARRARADIGADIEAPGQARERDLASLVVANARRVQESLRVIEELSKLSGIGLDSDRFKKSRFSLYAIERDLVSRLLRKDKAGRIRGYYAIIDTRALAGRRHLEAAGEVIRGGAKILQLRDKTLSRKGLFSIARQLKNLCAENDVLFIVNDYLDIALAVDADGLHLGQDDLPAAAARQLLPLDKLLGCSVTTAKQAITAELAGADYIAAGAIYPTTSKEAVTVIGLKGLEQIKKAVKLPLVAIGGITADNIATVLSAGADSAAMISAVLQAESIEEATRQIVAEISGSKKAARA